MNTERTIETPRRSAERGSIMAYTVVSVLFLFLALGLGVDLAHLYTVKTELQNAADAAALAGASALTLPNPDRIGTAVDRAVMVLNKNKYSFNNKAFVEGENPDLSDLRQYVRFAVNLSEFDGGGTGISEAAAAAAPENIRFVRVITPSVPVSVFFSAFSLGSQRNIAAKAVSGLSVPGNVSVCISPLSAIQCPPGDATCTLGDFAGDCGGVTPTEPDPDENGVCDPTKEFCKGCTYTIRSEGAGGPSAGNYQILACAGNGGSVVRDSLAAYNDCKCGLQSVGDEIEIPTEPGEVAGPVAQGLNVRFNIYGGGIKYSSSIPPDTNINDGTWNGKNGKDEAWSGITWDQYQAGSPFTAPSNPGVENRRVIIIPIIPQSEFDGGRDTVKIGGLGGFFLRSRVNGTNGDIKVEYIGDEIVDVIGFDPNDDNITNLVTPVLYR